MGAQRNGIYIYTHTIQVCYAQSFANTRANIGVCAKGQAVARTPSDVIDDMRFAGTASPKIEGGGALCAGRLPRGVERRQRRWCCSGLVAANTKGGGAEVDKVSAYLAPVRNPGDPRPQHYRDNGDLRGRMLNPADMHGQRCSGSWPVSLLSTEVTSSSCLFTSSLRSRAGGASTPHSRTRY